MNKLFVFTAFVASMVLSACGKPTNEDNNELAQQKLFLDGERQKAKINAEFSGALYKAANPRFTSDFSLIGRSDDSQSLACPSGDGWAELSIMRVDGKTVDKTALMCSTYSTSIGCYRKEDFEKNANLAKQNSGCNTEVPRPLPVLK